MSSPDLKVSWWAETHPGRFRRNNEDAFRALLLHRNGADYLGKVGEADTTQGDFIFAVSDGMGGANAGEFASRIVVEKIGELMPRSFRLGAAGIHRGGLDFLLSMTRQVHAEMLRQSSAYEETRGMGATLSLIWVNPERIYFVHVGDSRIYQLPTGYPLHQVSEDHTHVGWLVRTGQITATQARFHPQKNQLQQCLGGNVRNLDPQLGTVRSDPGDYFVLCSDGVSDDLPNSSIDRFVREPPVRVEKLNPAERLVKEACDVAGRDNLTALVVKIDQADA